MSKAKYIPPKKQVLTNEICKGFHCTKRLTESEFFMSDDGLCFTCQIKQKQKCNSQKNS